ncbi:MAG: IS1182 family transposase [Chloroflexota bacterium]
MLGQKDLQTKLFYRFSLEEAVPQDDFYRKLEKAVDLSWVRQRVAHRYALIGRPSIDPEVIVKIELIGYLEGITSERQLMRQIADRLSLHRYIGYDLDEEVPDHSTLSRARDLLGRELFQEVFDLSVRLCQAAGMVGGVHVSGDRSLVKANASMDSLEPRVVQQTPKEHVDQLFAENPVPREEVKEPAEVVSLTDRPEYPTHLPVESKGGPVFQPSKGEEGVVAGQDKAEDATGTESPEDGGRKKATKGKDRLDRNNSTHVSRTDPEATIVTRPGKGTMLAYSVEYWTDSRAGVITHVDAYTGAEAEHKTVMKAVKRQREVFDLPLASLSYDKGSGRGRLYRQLQDAGIVPYIPYREQANSTSGPGLYGLESFQFDEERNVYICPGGHELGHSHLKVRWPWASHVWEANAKDCQACALRCKCTKGKVGRRLQVGIYQKEYEEMTARLAGPGARLAAIARRTGPEPRFGEGKQWHGLGRAKYRGRAKVRGQALLTAAAQNLKKYVKWVWRRGQGVGMARLTEMNGAGLPVLTPTLQHPVASAPSPC